MTDIPVPQETAKETPAYVNTATLEDLFYLGYTESKPIVVFENREKNYRIEVIFRTLVPYEIRDVYEHASKFNAIFSQAIAEKIETLARAIKTINGQPLYITTADRDTFKKNFGREPDSLDQARVILTEKIKSPLVLDALWKEYEKFKDEVARLFEDDFKKKF